VRHAPMLRASLQPASIDAQTPLALTCCAFVCNTLYDKLSTTNRTVTARLHAADPQQVAKHAV